MRLVADTNTLISGLLWVGKPRDLMVAAVRGECRFITTQVLLAELERVLSRDKFKGRLDRAGLTVTNLLQAYSDMAEFVTPASISPTIIRDPDDDHVLACALGGQAEAIVSGDADLLNLRQFQGIRVITAAQALAAMVMLR